LQIPNNFELAQSLDELSTKSDAVARCLMALDTGSFTDPNGQTEQLGNVRVSRSEIALLAHISRNCPKPLSIEIGFGMGSSAAVMLASRVDAGDPFEHLVFDPYGLGGGRGAIVEAYLKEHFGRQFQRFWEHSAIGLARIWSERGPEAAGLIFIDGGHRFEDVLMDFYLADRLCCVGGAIVFDDALFPAIETVIQYLITNRPDYEVHHLIADNATVAVRRDKDRRAWDAFNPFEVPQRVNWMVAPTLKPELPARAHRDWKYRLSKWMRKRRNTTQR
jgi:hypothetical protein